MKELQGDIQRNKKIREVGNGIKDTNNEVIHCAFCLLCEFSYIGEYLVLEDIEGKENRDKEKECGHVRAYLMSEVYVGKVGGKGFHENAKGIDASILVAPYCKAIDILRGKEPL